MSEYSELIKKFDKIREYMHDFYIYGFMSREDFNQKSLRTYDNERRRIESYLSEYMEFRNDNNGKNVFVSVDSSEIKGNPLYRAFKAKSFTKYDITLDFIILDILYEEGSMYTCDEIIDKIINEYLSMFENPEIPDISTVRQKLNEYNNEGILNSTKSGRKVYYGLNRNGIELNSDILQYFSEVSPLGVVGSYLLDKCEYDNEMLRFKHHYIMHALESEIVYDLLDAIHNKQYAIIENNISTKIKYESAVIIPLKFLISVQGGRRYIAAYNEKSKSIKTYRLDYIISVKKLNKCEEFDGYLKHLNDDLSKMWGVSTGKNRKCEYLSFLLCIQKNEQYIVNRLKREGRNGTVTQIDENTYKYEIYVYDTLEMLPWLRTFIGRIINLESDNKKVTEIFYNDLKMLQDIYLTEEADI